MDLLTISMAATTVQPSHAASPTGTTNLSHLPSELLIMIVDTILPGDVEAFTSTCQRIYQLSARRRSIHRALKKRYTNVKVDWDRSPGVGNPMKLLGEILLNQRYFVGHYVKSIYVHEGDLRGDLLAEEILDAFDGFNDLIHALPIFKNNEQLAYQVHNMLRHQDSDYLWLLLLSILPEIETIRLQPDFTQHEGVGYAFDAFGKLPHGIAPFSKLFKVTCEVPAADWNRISHAILPWFSIPSVRHVSARRWQCTSNHLPEIGHWMPACSNVQSIEFIDCVIDPEALSAMLKHVRLERFRYGEPYSQDSRVWDVAPIVAVLIEHQAETLLHLNMVGVPRESFEDAESTTKFMTLQPFKKLLTFEGHISMFPKVRNGGHRIKRDLSVDLHGVVPPTLEVLGLVEKEGLQAPVVDFYPDYISLQGLAAAPNLKTFTCVGIDLAKDARRALAAAGVWYKELETYKTASPLA